MCQNIVKNCRLFEFYKKGNSARIIENLHIVMNHLKQVIKNQFT